MGNGNGLLWYLHWLWREIAWVWLEGKCRTPKCHYQSERCKLWLSCVELFCHTLGLHCHVWSTVSLSFHLPYRHEIFVYLQGTCEASLNRSSVSQHFECCDAMKYAMEKSLLQLTQYFHFSNIMERSLHGTVTNYSVNMYFHCFVWGIYRLTTDSVSMAMGDLCNVWHVESRWKTCTHSSERLRRPVAWMIRCVIDKLSV